MLDPASGVPMSKDDCLPGRSYGDSSKKKALSDVGYPKGPCKIPYSGNPFMFERVVTLAGLKNICDQNGIQLEVTFKPTSIRFVFTKANPEDGSVKRKQYLFKNDSLRDLDGARFSKMLMETTFLS